MLSLILFFGLHQRNRPQLYFRFWFVGWVFVLSSLVVWDAARMGDPALLVQKSVRWDLLVLAGLSFTLSFLATPERLRRTLWMAAAIAVPGCLALDLQVLRPLSPPTTQAVVAALTLVTQAAAIAFTQCGAPLSWRWRRWAIQGFCAVMGIGMTLQVMHDPRWVILPALLAEFFLFAAYFSATVYGVRSMPGAMGALGFTAWAIFYPLADFLANRPEALHTLYDFWNLPKYCVGISMLLRVFKDAADEKDRLSEQYRTLYEDFRMLYESHPHPMWIFSPRTQCFLALNRAAVETHGYTEEELLGMRLENLEVPMDAETEAKAHTVPVPTDGRRARFRCQDGRVLWVNVYERRVAFQGQTARLIMARDVTDLMEFNDEMARRAQHDELTGLPNRALFAERLAAAMAASQGLGQEQGQLAVLAIDIDHFKQINDTYGHAVGDKCLAVVASRLKSRIRQVDTIARIGGEEFMAVVGGLRGSAVALKVAQQLLHAFREPVRLGDCDLQVTISIGVAIYPDHATDATELRRLADQALYRAKREGRDCVRMAGEADRVGFREDVHQP
jgi:diguanylate cyclase (GGDEF)-like protein/PAS domain S-box-containing protein